MRDICWWRRVSCAGASPTLWLRELLAVPLLAAAALAASGLVPSTLAVSALAVSALADEPPVATLTTSTSTDKEVKSNSEPGDKAPGDKAPSDKSSSDKSSSDTESTSKTTGNSAEAKQHRASARELSRAFRDAAAVALPSVVTIKVRTKAVDDGGVIDIIGGDDSSFDGFGSGVIIEHDGLILTNHHVVKDYKHIEVMLLDGRQFVARDVKSDPPSDLAILRIDANEKLPIAETGDARELDVGDWVLAIGSPFKLHSSVSAGIISGKNRPLGDLVPGRFLQTDAAVNPGNSGGALIDLDGKVIGINTAISSNTGTFQGVGFAIPINRALWVKKELEAQGRVRRARMGAQLGSIPTEVAKQLEMTAGGAYVVSVAPGRPAATAGVLSGDIVVSFDHQRVSDKEELREMIAVSPIDQPIEMNIVRGGEKLTLTIKLEPLDQ